MEAWYGGRDNDGQVQAAVELDFGSEHLSESDVVFVGIDLHDGGSTICEWDGDRLAVDHSPKLAIDAVQGKYIESI